MLIQKSAVKKLVHENGKMLSAGAMEVIDMKVEAFVRACCRATGKFKKITAEDVCCITSLK